MADLEFLGCPMIVKDVSDNCVVTDGNQADNNVGGRDTGPLLP